MGQHVDKKKYRTKRNAQKGLMNLWGADPTADIQDLHVYICPVCGFWHVGHISKYEKMMERRNGKEKGTREGLGSGI